ncbi:MAG TPA: ScyD/ScyE family protein [Pseudonocardiaceae bacterium]
MKSLAAVLAPLALLAPAVAPPSVSSPPTSSPSVSVVATGLAAPKYISIGPDGLYVADSGTGGPDCVVGVANTTVTHVCAGATGSIVRINGHQVTTVEGGVASASVASTHGVSGVTAVGFTGGRMAVLMDDGGVGPTGVSAIANPYGECFGKLDLAASDNGGPLTPVADIAAFHATHPQPPLALGGLPGETLYDSDPHDMVAYQGGFAVADAAANDVVLVRTSGQVSVLARIPTRLETAPSGTLGPGTPAMPVHAQAVPSSVAVGPDGALYVGLLRGVPSLPGTAEVDRIVPGKAPEPVVTGLTRVSDIAFDAKGRLDILESTTSGALLRATLNGAQPTTATNLDVPGLNSPVGLAIAKSGTVYVTNDTTNPGNGELVAVNGLS